MANTPNPVIFKITDAGRLAILDAQKQGLTLSLKTLVAGTSQYIASGKETAIKAEAIRADIVTSGIEKESKTLRFSATLNSVATKTIYELGLLTSDNNLFAIAATNEPLLTVYSNVAFIGSFGLSLDNLNVDVIKVSTDPDSAIVIKMMEDHIAAPDPHPQYVKLDKLTQLNAKVDKLGQNINGAAGDLAGHLANPNPHPQYTLKTDHDAHVKLFNDLKAIVDAQGKTITTQGQTINSQGQSITKVTGDLDTHIKAANPHSQYAKKTDLADHSSAANPHTQYLQDSDLDGLKKQVSDLQSIIDGLQKNTVGQLPVGSVYVTTTNYADGTAVNKALGYGTWVRYSEGKALVGLSTKAVDPAWTKTLKGEFGEYEHQLTVEEMPRHTHDLNFVVNNIRGNTRPATQSTSASPSNLDATNAGGDQPHNNVQPSTVTGLWLRTA